MPLPVPPAMLWHRVKPSKLSQYSASRSAVQHTEHCLAATVVRGGQMSLGLCTVHVAFCSVPQAKASTTGVEEDHGLLCASTHYSLYSAVFFS
jgi:hypothetical protein